MVSLRGYGRTYRTLSRDAKLLLLIGALESIPFGILAVGLPLYLHILGYRPVVIGSVFTVIGAVAVLLIMPFGILADRVGRRRVAMLGGFFSGAAFLLAPFAANATALYAMAALAGLAEALFFSTLQSLLADATTPENRTTVFGLSFFLGAAATALGALASATPEILRERAGWDVVASYTPLFVGAGLALLTTPVLLSRLTVAEVRKAAGEGWLPRRSGGTIARFLVSNLIIGLGAGLIVPIFSLWFLLKYGQAEAFTGPLFALGAATNGFAYLAAPLLAQRFGMVRTVTALSASGTLFLVGLAFTFSLPLAAGLYLLRNMTMNMSWPIMSSFLMGVVEPSERSSASAVVGLSFRLPFAVSTAFGAAMMAQQVDSPLMVTALLYAVGTTAYFAFFRKVPEPRPAGATSAVD